MSKSKESTVPIYKKYAKTLPTNWLDPSAKLKPSDFTKPSVDVFADDYPMIVEFVNMQDNTSQVSCTVDVDSPIFQPSPKIVVFEDYAPFAPIEKKIYFRNNDAVREHAFIYSASQAIMTIYNITFTGWSENKGREARLSVLRHICTQDIEWGTFEAE